MKRLTKKANHYCDTDIDNEYKFADEDTSIGEIVDKLGRLEDLEENLGCPLEIVFKVLVNGIWYEDVANRMTHIGVGLDTANYECEYLLREYDNAIRFLPRNYKKTWWLKKDKSE